MKVMKNINLLCAVIVMGALAQNAMASVLPTSSLDGGKWGGHKSYSDGDGLDVMVTFNVYDKSSGEFNWEGEADIPSTDQYLYVYKMYCLTGSSDVTSFGVLNSDGDSIASLINSTCSQDDGSDGISPDPSVSATQGMWLWSSTSMTAGEHSWYLIYSSAYAPTTGDFTVNSEESSPPVPSPEPCTLALFGAASALFAAKRSRKRRAV